MTEFWIVGGRGRRRVGPFATEDEAIKMRQLVATQLHTRLREDQRDYGFPMDEEIVARLRKVQVVERSVRVASGSARPSTTRG